MGKYFFAIYVKGESGLMIDCVDAENIMRQRPDTTSPAISPRSPVKPESPSDKRRSSLTPQLPADLWSPQFGTAFKYLLVVRLVAAVAMPFIADCDEVFNFWEPLHYLQFGYGHQTWEYAPEFSIRTWAYISMYLGPAQLLRFVHWLLVPSFLISQKTFIFYSMRCLLGTICAYIEASFYKAVDVHVGVRIARYLLVMLTFAPGMFYASTAFLPSTAAMYTTMLAFTQLIKSYAMYTRSESYIMKTAICWPIFWFAFGSIYAWPFSGAVGLPLVFEEVFVRSFYMNNKKKENRRGFYFAVIKRILVVVSSAAISTALLIAPIMLIDFLFYRKWIFVPWNIVHYNVFNGNSKLYGTEPWYFYFVNGFLNFNIVLILAVLSVPVIWLSHHYSYRHIVTCTNVSFLASAHGRPHELMFFKLTPVYLWLAIFSAQPHKEERFLFVIYPLICFNAAVALSFIRGFMVKYFSTPTISKIVSKKPVFITSIAMWTFIALSLSRLAVLNHGYKALVNIYHEGLYSMHNNLENGHRKDLCLDNDWYRFPSHYLVDPQQRVYWMDNGNSGGGLLPKYFNETVDTSKNVPHPIANYLTNDISSAWLASKLLAWLDSRPGTYHLTTSADFNDKNEVLRSRFNNQDKCRYLIRYFPASDSTKFSDIAGSDVLIGKRKSGKVIRCLPMLDRQTRTMYRAFFIPYKHAENTIMGRYCLLEIL